LVSGQQELVIGLGIQVRDHGRKTFTLDYTFEGRCHHIVGDFPDRSTVARSNTRNGIKCHMMLHCTRPVYGHVTDLRKRLLSGCYQVLS
jgi:hypothetical protein